VPKLPREWAHVSANVLATRDDVIYAYPLLNAGQTVARIRFHFRIYGRTNESDLDVPFDAYYIGVAIVPTISDPADFNAWADRDTVDWVWWEGCHFRPYFQVGTPGQVWLFYPGEDYERDCKAQRLVTDLVGESVIFSFARSGGTVLTDQRVNFNASILVLG
jgi:hypothetical protein